MTGTMQPIAFDEVADLYDVYVRTEFDIPFWLEECQGVKGKVLELMSGTGRVSLPLLRAGVDLTCVDRSPGMLGRLRAKAAEEGLVCESYCQDIAALDVPGKYSLIFIPFHSFSEILDAGQRLSALRRIREHLAEGGRFVVTLQNPVVRTADMDGAERSLGKYAMDNGNSLTVRVRMGYNPTTQLASGEQTYEISDAAGTVTERRVLEIRFRLFGRDEFEKLLREAGFEVEMLYGDYGKGELQEGKSAFMLLALKGMG